MSRLHDALVTAAIGFKRSTTIAEVRDGLFLITCSDLHSLIDVLSQLFQDMQGVDDLNTPEIRELLLRARYDPAEFYAIPLSGRGSQIQQQVNVEVGDIGEAIACLALIVYFEHEAASIHPKNLLKLNNKYSERGADIIVAEITHGAPQEVGRLIASGDRLHLVEAKATATERIVRFKVMLNKAKSSAAQVATTSFWQELLLIEERLRLVDGDEHRSSKIKGFALEYVLQSGAVIAHAHLHGNEEPNETVVTGLCDAKRNTSFSRVVIFRGDIEAIRRGVFSYRRVADAS